MRRCLEEETAKKKFQVLNEKVETGLYQLARQRDQFGKDVQQVRVIKGTAGNELKSEESVLR